MSPTESTKSPFEWCPVTLDFNTVGVWCPVVPTNSGDGDQEMPAELTVLAVVAENSKEDS